MFNCTAEIRVHHSFTNMGLRSLIEFLNNKLVKTSKIQSRITSWRLDLKQVFLKALYSTIDSWPNPSITTIVGKANRHFILCHWEFLILSCYDKFSFLIIRNFFVKINNNDKSLNSFFVKKGSSVSIKRLLLLSYSIINLWQ